MNHEKILEKCQKCKIYYEYIPEDRCPFIEEFLVEGKCEYWEEIEDD